MVLGDLNTHCEMESHGLSTWTDEKHIHFLNAIESSFVGALLQTKSRLLRLDRHLPDSSESTLDLKTHAREKHASFVFGVGSEAKMGGKADKRSRRPSASQSLPYNSSEDQVVPQLWKQKG